MALRHDHILNPVTALGFYITDSGSTVVFAGEGSFLKAFDAVTTKLLSVCEIFDGQTIHGIALREASNGENALQMAIWGGNSLIVLGRKDVERHLLHHTSCFTSSVIAVSDWILDVAISPQNDECVLITAHNTVLRTRHIKTTKEQKVETLSSPSRSILYSADLVWESRSEILVAAGTVFGEIIVWKCSTTGESQVIYTFSGHEGSIFGVDISPPVVQPNGTTGRLLASCSDDRTIRIWDLSESSQSFSRSTMLMRETGFGENDGPKSLDVLNRCIATVMAHASRIWSVKFLAEEPPLSNPSSISVLSFGEDSTAQHWSLNFGHNYVRDEAKDPLLAVLKQKKGLEPDAVAQLNQLRVFDFHRGKHLWSTARFYLGKSNYVLATGGADGKISMYTVGADETLLLSPREMGSKEESIVSTLPTQKPPQSLVWALEDIVSSLGSSAHTQGDVREESELSLLAPESVLADVIPANTQSSKMKKPRPLIKDGFNRYAFASERQTIATTNQGRVLVGDIDTNVLWSEAPLPESSRLDLKNYNVIEGLPEIGIAFLAGTNGTIFAYRDGHSIQVAGQVEGKILNMFKMLNVETNSYELLVTVLSSPIATLFTVEHSSIAAPRLSYSTTCNLPHRFLVTSAGKINGLLVLGARSGLLAVYETAKSADPINIWTPPKDSPSDAIATILPLTPRDSIRGSNGHFLTTDRTGCYSIFSCTATPVPNDVFRGVNICRVHHSRLPLGPMVEAAWFQDGDLFFYGFRSKSFVVWNESKHYEVSNVDCGGAHRSYAFCPSSTANGGCFVYTKASKLHFYSQRDPSHTILKQGGHGREIKASAVSVDGGLIATGAEDTAIRIWRYKSAVSNLDSRLDCLSIIEKHTTGIQHLQWHGSKYLFSSGGNEEFFIWAIRIIPNVGIGVECEASYPDRSAGGDLRIMSFDVTNFPSEAKDSSDLLISLAFSDSTIRTYAYSKAKGFALLAVGKYTSSCLTQLRHIQFSDGDICFLTAATDGNITLWKGKISKTELESAEIARHSILSSKKIHQSTIKALDLKVYSTYFVIVTGGDDNALAISVYPILCLQDSQVRPRIYILRSAHTAAITALSITSEGDNSGFLIVTSGNDQRVKSWQVRLDPNMGLFPNHEAQLDFSQVEDVFTSVADVGDLSILSATEGVATKAFIVGNGVDVWNMFKKSASR
ncbi:hypothetical protein ONS96_014468 [Cadophora gregata f. sp. sojae]|nr:hypothetical protein ONS96_014468 [Cadophora gregata f. sp. sojae]